MTEPSEAEPSEAEVKAAIDVLVAEGLAERVVIDGESRIRITPAGEAAVARLTETPRRDFPT